MLAYRGSKVYLHSFLSSAPVTGECKTPSPACGGGGGEGGEKISPPPLFTGGPVGGGEKTPNPGWGGGGEAGGGSVSVFAGGWMRSRAKN